MRSPMESTFATPRWWTDEHTTHWEAVLPELRRAFEASVVQREKLKNQSVDAPVHGETGTPANVGVDEAYAVPDRDWEVGVGWSELEPGFQYGVGARLQYPTHASWTQELETRLRSDWTEVNEPSTWQRVKRAVRRGFEHVKSST